MSGLRETIMLDWSRQFRQIESRKYKYLSTMVRGKQNLEHWEIEKRRVPEMLELRLYNYWKSESIRECPAKQSSKTNKSRERKKQGSK